MYYTHSLRTDLSEWKNRLHRATLSDLKNQVKYLLDHFKSHPLLAGLIHEACSRYPQDPTFLAKPYERIYHHQRSTFENQVDQASFAYQVLVYHTRNHNYNLHQNDIFGGDFKEAKEVMIEEYFGQIFNYLHDSLDKSSSTLYLLEKYKRRTEWFLKGALCDRYKNANNRYEKVLEDDLRLFLFDQGIDYPFSSPNSPSGQADVIGAINTKDPLVVEVKVVDESKSYGKNRIKEGFTQIVRYTNEYHKDFGYLVIYNMDDRQIDFKLSENTKQWPPRIVVNNKIYYFVVIDMYAGDSASKRGKTTVMEITDDDLVD